MRIKDHKLVHEKGVFDLTQRWAPNRVFALTPKKIVLHYDVCHDMDMNTRAQFASGLFYHVAIDGEDDDKQKAQVRQYCPFNRRGSHAKGHNNDSIGVVFVSPGPLIKGADGQLRTTYGRIWDPNKAYEAEHASGRAPRNWTHWAVYTHKERDAALAVCEVLISAYPTIKLITTHEQVSNQKFDIGPHGAVGILPYLRAAFPGVDVPEPFAK